MDEQPEDLATRMARDAARGMARDLAKKKPTATWVLYATGAVVVGIGVLGLLARLWFYAMALAVMAGLGGAVYLAVKPRVDALTAGRRERARLAAAQQEEQREKEAAEERQRQAAEKAAADQRKLEEQLAELKRRKG